MHNGYTHSFEAERTVALCTSRNLKQACFAINSRNLNLVAKRSLRKADRHFIQNIVAGTFKEWVRLNRQYDIQIARGASTRAYLAFTCDTYINAIVYTSRNIYDDTPIITHTALPVTFFTRSCDYSTFTSTALAHRDIDKLPKNGLLHATNFTCSLA